jgi:hypothetical protein
MSKVVAIGRSHVSVIPRQAELLDIVLSEIFSYREESEISMMEVIGVLALAQKQLMDED